MKMMQTILSLLLCIMLVTGLSMAVAESALWTCPRCGSVNDDLFCPNCGTNRPNTFIVGETVIFGHYPKTAEGTDYTPIEWLVLDVQDGKALLLSKYGLDAKPYNISKTSVTWETCSLRRWLNGEFINRAFSPEEQGMIVETTVSNGKDQGYREWRTDGGNNTVDRVFLLSYGEANRYLGVEYSVRKMISRTSPTVYAKAQGAWTTREYLERTTEGTPSGRWWLRSPGVFQSYAAVVHSSGGLYRYSVSDGSGSVRPALWVNLESFFSGL